MCPPHRISLLREKWRSHFYLLGERGDCSRHRYQAAQPEGWRPTADGQKPHLVRAGGAGELNRSKGHTHRLLHPDPLRWFRWRVLRLGPFLASKWLNKILLFRKAFCGERFCLTRAQTHCDDHSTAYTSIESLCCNPETNVIFISVIPQ